MTSSKAGQRLLRCLRLQTNRLCSVLPSCGYTLSVSAPFDRIPPSEVRLMDARVEQSPKWPTFEASTADKSRKAEVLDEPDESRHHQGGHTSVLKRVRVECWLPHPAAQQPARSPVQRLSSRSPAPSAIFSTCPSAGYTTGATSQDSDKGPATTCQYQGAQAYYDLLTKGLLRNAGPVTLQQPVSCHVWDMR